MPVSTRNQVYDATMTRFSRGEGMWWSEDDKAVYFDTTGGTGHFGQVFKYVPRTSKLTMVYKSTNSAVLESPDNLLVLPWNDIMLCEDGSGQDYLRILTQSGSIVDFARNSVSEFAGATFAQDTLFVNIQGVSYTLAIWGPWSSLT